MKTKVTKTANNKVSVLMLHSKPLNFKRTLSPFLEGMVSVLNLAGGYYGSDCGNENDEKSMENDWALVGSDIANATDDFRALHCVEA